MIFLIECGRKSLDIERVSNSSSFIASPPFRRWCKSSTPAGVSLLLSPAGGGEESCLAPPLQNVSVGMYM